MRCLNLAEYLNLDNNKIEFITKNHVENITQLIKKKYNVYELEVYNTINCNTKTWLGSTWEEDITQTIEIIKNKNIDLLIIDHYSIDDKWENKIKSYVKKIMVIDDLANRYHNCDLLLDHNITYYNYHKLVPQNCKILCGIEYLLIIE